MRVLLVVDDETDLAVLFERLLGDCFDQIHCAPDAAAAEQVLGRVEVTHLVVDSVLGDQGPSGHELVARWRSQRPSIGFAALFSGSTELEREALPGIDAIYIKPRGFEPLLERLRNG